MFSGTSDEAGKSLNKKFVLRKNRNTVSLTFYFHIPTYNFGTVHRVRKSVTGLVGKTILRQLSTADQSVWAESRARTI